MPIKEVQQTVKQHAVPQNIMQVEFKVIGSLTMRQFFYLIVAAILAVGAFKSGLPGFVRVPLAFGIALGGLAIAFLPVEDRGLDQWIANFFNAIYMPTQRTWRKQVLPPSYFLYQNAALLKSELLAVAPTASRRKLEQYLEHETGEKKIDPLDIQEDAYIQKVRASFATLPAVQVELEAPTTYTESSTYTKTFTPYQGIQPDVEVGTSPQIVKEGAGPTDITPPAQMPTEVTEPKVYTETGIPTSSTSPSIPNTPTIPTLTNIIQTPAPTTTTLEKAPAPSSSLMGGEIPLPKITTEEVQQRTPEGISKRPEIKTKPLRTAQRIEIKIPTHKGRGAAPVTESITPDRLTGRRFTNLSRTEGEIILPIRGERILKTIEEVVKEDINEKANELMKLVEQIKREPTMKTTQDPKEIPVTPVNKVVEDTMASLRTDNDKLAKQIEELKQNVQETKTAEERETITNRIENLQKDKEDADSQIASLQQKVAEMEEKLKEVQTEQPRVVVQKVIEKVNVPYIPAGYTQGTPKQQTPTTGIQPQKATFAPSAPITNIPNIINGVVKEANQKLIEGAIVIIKDARGDTVRALKTNKLGEFAITTPVPNGNYIIEISKEQNGTPLTFDRISLTVKGEVLPAVEFIGKL